MKKTVPMLLFLATTAVSAFAADRARSSSELERKADSLYSAKDAVLYNLDSGMLHYYEGNYKTAIERLSTAEALIDEYFTKSVTQNTAAFLTNDSELDYAGEDYEDIYLNLFKAIAYYKDDRWEEGFHELEAYKRKSSLLSQRRSQELALAREAARAQAPVEKSVTFYNSALAEYLTLLYYRSLGDANRVQYSGRMIRDVFASSPAIYPFATPSSLNAEQAVQRNETRLNFVVFSGISPQKIERTEYYSNALVLSLPELVIPQSTVSLIRITAKNTDTGASYNAKLEQIEDLGLVAEDIFKSRAQVVYYKSVARAMTKGTATAGASIAGDMLSDSDSTALSVLGAVLSGASIANENMTERTEHADTRHAKYFPGRADVGGITVEPGTYDIIISYCGRTGKELYHDSLKGVQAEKGKLNLVSADSTMRELDDEKKSERGRARTVTVRDDDAFDRIYFDIGTEPESSASSTYGLFQYNWTRTFASNIKLKYTSATEIEDEIAGYGNAVGIDKHKEFELDLLPAIWTIPIGSKNRLSLSFGGSYQYIKENYFAGMFDVNGLMLDEGDEGKYFTVKNDKTAHIFAPRLGLDWRMPLHKNVSLNFDVYVNPIYALSLSQSMGYHSDQTELPFDYGGDNTVFRWSAPYVDAKVYADFFQFVRLVSQLSYQRLDFQQMDWASDYESLVGYDDVQSITKLRFGVELLVGKRHTARARGGVYYQNEWNVSSYTGETTYKGKWVISIGTER